METGPRLFVRETLAEGGRIDIDAHYLGNVLRRRTGDKVRLFNGADGEYLARIENLGKRHATLAVEIRLRPQLAEPGPILLFAKLRRDATELVIQKATELGAAAIRPVITARTNPVRLNLERLRAIATEAAEQCERLTLPELHDAVELPELLRTWAAGQRIAAAIERHKAGPPTEDADALLIGPEGGFAPEELRLLHQQPFVVAASLGPRILRAETAAIAGLAWLALARASA